MILPIRLSVPGFAEPIVGELDVPDDFGRVQEVFSEAQAAAFLGDISVTTLQRLRAAGEIACVPVTQRRIVYRREQLVAFLDRKARAARAAARFQTRGR